MASGSSLSARFARALAIAALCGVVLFAVMQSLGSAAIDCYVENSDYLEKCANERTESFQKYVDAHKLASTDTAQLFDWCKQQPPLLMEVFHDGRLVFNSSYSGDENLFDRDIEARYYDWYSYYTIEFSDGTAELFIYCDDAYQLHVWATIFCAIVSFLAFLLIFLAEVRKVARYIRLLSSEIQTMESGVLDREVTVCGSDELGTLARSLDSMRTTFLAQRAAEELFYQANQSLVTGLSHDLRTPLTKLMLYTEIIRSGKYENEDKLKEYLGRIDGIAGQIKSLADNILLYSMTAAKQSDERCEAKSLKKAVQEELSETIDYLNQRGFEVILSPAWPEGEIIVCDSFVKRLLDNVASNISRYADSSDPVVVGFVRSSTHMGLAFRNAIAVDPNDQDGFGVGLANITSMMEAMGGFGRFQKDGDYFEIELWFLKKHAQKEP